MSRYSDFNSRFTPHPLVRDLPVINDADAINQALRNLIYTNKGEVPYKPEYGSNIRSLLFELADDDLEFVLREQIFEVINNYEPRVSLNTVNVRLDPDRNSIEITLVYFIINNPQPINFSFIIERVR